ncbi:hypothetical protein HMPREF1546_00423 [Oscillibacter sp. KLE 1745]|nr:hypothetical protein HMPREF1546_00423 [Oscillibacter sp. KLE 1745]
MRDAKRAGALNDQAVSKIKSLQGKAAEFPGFFQRISYAHDFSETGQLIGKSVGNLVNACSGFNIEVLGKAAIEMVPVITGAHVSITELQMFTPGIIGNVLAVPTVPTYHIRTDGDSVSNLQIIPIKGEISGPLFINGHDFHSDLMTLNNRKGQINLVFSPFVLNSFSTIAVLIRAADTGHQNFANSRALTQCRHVKFTDFYMTRLNQDCCLDF